MAQKLDARQIISRDALSNLLGIAGTELDDLLRAINKEANAPLRMSASLTPDAKINFEPSEVEAADLAGRTGSPVPTAVSAQIPSVVASTVDFQSGATTGATFNITFPVSTVGYFRRIGFSLDSAGVIQAVFSAEASTLGAVANSGTVFVKGALPIGWIDLEATASSPGRFKTAGSATNIIENKVSGANTVHRIVGSGSTFIPTVATDSSTTGSNTTVSALTTSIIRLTNGSLDSISGIPAGVAGQSLIIENKTGNPFNVNNDDAGASAADRILTGTSGPVSMLDNATFLFTYDAVSSRWMLTGGSGSGSGTGGINYIKFGNAEAGNTGWVTYADAAGALPVDGIGGSPTLSLSNSSSSPLRGLKSYILTKDAADRQGEGASYDFTIDNADKGTVIEISFEHVTNSGTYATGDMVVSIFDVTNNLVIQPLNFNIEDTQLVSEFATTFQTSFNSTSYRLIFHCASTSALAYSLKIDNIVVGPKQALASLASIGMSAYDPTSSIGIGFNDVAGWSVDYDKTGSFNPTTGVYTVPVSGLYQINGRLVAQSLTSWVVGQYVQLSIMHNGVSYTTAQGRAGGNQGYLPVHASHVLDCQAGDLIKIQTSSDNSSPTFAGQRLDHLSIVRVADSVGAMPEPRVIAFRAADTSATAIGNTATLIPFNVPTFDTHSCFSGGIYTVKTPGKYKVNVHCTLDVTGAFDISAGRTFTTSLYKNGGAVSLLGRMEVTKTSNSYYTSQGEDTIDCKAGDTLAVYGTQNFPSSGTVPLLAQAEYNYLTIERISGPSAAVPNGDTVAFRAAGTPTQATFTNGITPAKWASLGSTGYDTHGGYDSSSGHYIIQAPGLYEVSAKFSVQGSGLINYQTGCYIYAASAGVASDRRWYGATQTISQSPQSSAIVRLKPGDIVYPGAYFDIDAGTSFSAGVDGTMESANSFEVRRVGN